MKHSLLTRFETTIKFYLLLAIFTQFLIALVELPIKMIHASWTIFYAIALVLYLGSFGVIFLTCGKGVKKKILSLLKYVVILILIILLEFSLYYFLESSLEKVFFAS